MANKFREEDHPRDDDGKFTKKGAGESSNPKDLQKDVHEPGAQGNITESSDARLLQRDVKESYFDYEKHILNFDLTEQEMLQDITIIRDMGHRRNFFDRYLNNMLMKKGEYRGFKRISKEAFNNLNKEEYIIVCRGIHPNNEANVSAEEIHKSMYENKPINRTGVYGSGIYCTDQIDRGNFYKKENGKLLLMAIPKDAKIIDYSEVMAKKNEIKQYLEENKDKIISHYGEMGGNVFEGIKKHLQNPSHIAFLMGYDIIKIELSKHGVGDNNRASNDTYYLPNNPKDIYLMEE